jgi:uncharacterized membrane protein YhaH (DUF805 family)
VACGSSRAGSGAPVVNLAAITIPHLDPLLALAVFVSTAATDTVYVLFNAAIVARKRVPAANWSAGWYMLSAFAVISYTQEWIYVAFAAIGSWVGAYLTVTWLHARETKAAEAKAAEGA